MAISKEQIKVGDRVYYQPSHFFENEFDPGVVSYIGERKDGVFVIYKPNDLNEYKQETQAFTLLEDLHYYSSPQEAKTMNFLTKYAD